MNTTHAQRLVFVSHADSGDIHSFASGLDGQLHPHQVIALGGNLMPMALSPTGQRLYVARRSEPMAVITLAIAPVSGKLSVLSEAPLPASMAYISLDKQGQTLFAASYHSDLLSVHPIDHRQCVGTSTHIQSTGKHAHCVVADPTNHFVFAAILGSDQIVRLHYNETTRAMCSQPTTCWSAPAGSGPRHFRFHPNGRFVYVLNELDASLDVFDFRPATGEWIHKQRLSSMPRDSDCQPWAADLHLTPNGRFLFSCERNTSTLAAFGVSADDGRVTLLSHTETETQPRGFAIMPTGDQVLVVGQRSDHLSLYALDQESGGLTLKQRLATGQNPNWIEITR